MPSGSTLLRLHSRRRTRSAARRAASYGDAYRHITDFGLFKNFIITQGIRAQFRVEAFNLFNETNFTTIGTAISTPAQFGRILAAADPRLVQLGFKVTF